MSNPLPSCRIPRELPRQTLAVGASALVRGGHFLILHIGCHVPPNARLCG